MPIWHLWYWNVCNGEIDFQSMGFIIGSIGNWALNHQNCTIYASNFDLKLSHYILNNISHYDFAKMSKSQKITLTGIFSFISIWCHAQKRLIVCATGNKNICCFCFCQINPMTFLKTFFVHDIVKVGCPVSWRLFLIPGVSEKSKVWCKDYQYFKNGTTQQCKLFRHNK